MKRILLISLIITANQLFASAATVLFTQNKVVANRNGSERVLVRGASLDPGDQITTSVGAAINFQYSNGTLVNIGSDSKYTILAYNPKQSEVQIKAELSQGKLELQNAGKIKETLKTPIVSLAILGTHIRVAALLRSPPNDNATKKKKQCDGLRASEVTNIQVLEGTVEARGKYLRAGDSVRITCDHMTNSPFPNEGFVSSASGSAGKIAVVATGPTVEAGSGGAIGAQIVTFIDTNLETGEATSSGMQALEAAAMISDIALACNPTA